MTKQSELSVNEMNMIADMLVRTKTQADIEENLEKMKGSCAFTPSQKCLDTYKELAQLRIKRFRS